MRMLITPSAIALSTALLLAACEQQHPTPKKPDIDTRSDATPASMGAAGDTSVPRAETVFSRAEGSPRAAAEAAAASSAATAPTRTNSKMSRAEESAAMPMAGQNNDHSAPAAASAPERSKTGAKPDANTGAKP